MVQMLANGWLNFCWEKIEEIVDDPQNGVANQEKLEVLLTYLELINQSRQSSDLTTEQEEAYQEIVDWLKYHLPKLDISELQ